MTTALAFSSSTNIAAHTVPVEGTRFISPSSSAEDQINARVEADRYVPEARLNISSDQVTQEDEASFAIPEFRAIPAHADQVFAATKEWEGYIRSVGNSHFIAELADIRGEAADETDVAEIPISDVPREDRHLIREGAVFRYLVGYAKSRKGVTRRRHVYFRRGRMRDPEPKTELWTSIVSQFRE